MFWTQDIDSIIIPLPFEKREKAKREWITQQGEVLSSFMIVHTCVNKHLHLWIFIYTYKHTSETDAAVFEFDEHSFKQFSNLALRNSTKDAYDLTASTKLSDWKMD